MGCWNEKEMRNNCPLKRFWLTLVITNLCCMCISDPTLRWGNSCYRHRDGPPHTGHYPQLFQRLHHSSDCPSPQHCAELQQDHGPGPGAGGSPLSSAVVLMIIIQWPQRDMFIIHMIIISSKGSTFSLKLDKCVNSWKSRMVSSF